MTSPWSLLAASLRYLLVTTLLLGGAYPLVVSGVSKAMFPALARGERLSRADGSDAGLLLIGQRFEAAYYFHGRPSAAGDGYDPRSSGGSNRGPTSAALAATMAARAAALRSTTEPLRVIPVDLLTASASGLDPHVSPEGALFQVARVAAARGTDPAAVRTLVQAHIEPPQLGLLGQARVNVLRLNLALDARWPATRPAR